MTGRLLRRPPNNSPPKHRNHASYNRVKKVAGFPLYDGFNTLGIRAEKSRYDLARMEPRAAD